MKVLLAGATGAIGRPLVSALQDGGHDVVALTRDPARAAVLEQHDVEPLLADALDRADLLRAAERLRVDAVVHQLTALSKAPARHSGMSGTNVLRTTGTRNLLDVAAQAGARRFLTQSIVFGYGYTDHGSTVLTEDAPFGEPAGGATDPHLSAMATNEDLVLGSSELDGIALRYGVFYADDSMPELLRARKVPVPSGPERELPWIHLDDAVAATVSALEQGRPGTAYNIVDDEPTSWRSAVSAMAAAYGTRPPRVVPGWLIRLAAPYVAAMVLDTSMRVSNARAADELGWTPRYRNVRDGVRSVLSRSAED